MINPNFQTLYLDDKLSLTVKSWLKFYSCGLLNPDARERLNLAPLLSLHERPWYIAYTTSRNSLRPKFSSWRLPGTIEDLDMRREYQSLVDMWYVTVLHNSNFWVNWSETKGLHLVVSRVEGLSYLDIQRSIIGLLEPINADLYEFLKAIDFNSLYSSDRRYSILYGPLSLVNGKLDYPDKGDLYFNDR